MTRPFSEWTVLPHGRMRLLDDNLLTVAGVLRMPAMGNVMRRMTIARTGDGRLVVYSAIALDEAEMKALQAFGEPTWLIVPSGIHRMDARIWKDRYPDMTVIAPEGARAKVEEVVPVDATAIDFGDPVVNFVPVDGTSEREAALVVLTTTGTTLVLNDVLFNLANRPGVGGWLWKTIGMTADEPHLPGVIKFRLVSDEAALQDQLLRWSRIPSLNRVIVSHGAIIEDDARGALVRVAQHLAPRSSRARPSPDHASHH